MVQFFVQTFIGHTLCNIFRENVSFLFSPLEIVALHLEVDEKSKTHRDMNR